MSLFDSILKQVAGAPDDVANLASKLGLPAELTEKAIAARGKSHQEPGDTVELAAQKTGLDTGQLGKIVQAIGGEGSLGEFARMIQENPQAKGILGMLDRDGDGNPLNDLAGLAGGLLGKK